MEGKNLGGKNYWRVKTLEGKTIGGKNYGGKNDWRVKAIQMYEGGNPYVLQYREGDPVLGEL